MSNMYDRLKGVYRIRAHFDIGKEDFIRTEDGELDEDFDDYFCRCNFEDEIHYAYDDLFVGYIWDLERASIIIDRIKEIDKKIIISKEKTDGEVLIWFDIKNIDVVAKIMGAEKKFANRSPFDARNLKD